MWSVYTNIAYLEIWSNFFRSCWQEYVISIIIVSWLLFYDKSKKIVIPSFNLVSTTTLMMKPL